MLDKSSLKEYLASYPELLGEQVVKKFGKDLPFLFKVCVSCSLRSQVGADSETDRRDTHMRQVLAIRKALSIQAHPDKALAKRLHEEKPDIYKGIVLLPLPPST